MSEGTGEFEPIVFRSSRWVRIGTTGKGILGGLFLQAVAAGSIWFGIGYGIYDGNIPIWVHALGVVVTLLLPFLAWAYLNINEPTRLILHEEDMLIGGLLVMTRIRYDDVRLLRIEEVEEDMFSKSYRLVIRRRRGRKRRIILAQDHAMGCFHAMRNMCPQAPAIAFDEGIFDTVSQDHLEEGRHALVDEISRKIWWTGMSAVASWILVVVLGWIFLAAGSGSVWSWVSLLFVLLSAVVFTAQVRSQYLLRRAVLAAPLEDFGSYIADEEDEDFEEFDIDHTEAGTP